MSVPGTPALSHWCPPPHGGWGSYNRAGNCERCGQPRKEPAMGYASQYKRITELNQWESVSYHLGTKEEDKLSHGDLLYLLLPDRTAIKARVELLPTVRSYSEQGQSRPTEVPGVRLHLLPLKPAVWRGLNVEIDHTKVRARRP